VGIIGAPSALLLILLIQAGQRVHCASGRVVAAMSAAFTGEGKTDAKDAYVIAETARIRSDLTVIDPVTDLVRNLALLTGHRADLVADRVRMINRLRDVLTSVFPALEREFDYAHCKGALVLLTGYASPDADPPDRREPPDRVVAAPQRPGFRQASDPGGHRRTHSEDDPAGAGHRRRHRHRAGHQHPWHWTGGSKTWTSRSQTPSTTTRRLRSSSPCPAFRPILGATLLAAAGDLRAFPSAGHLAAAAASGAGAQRLGPAVRKTCTNRAATAGCCGTCSTSRPKSQ